MSWLTDTLIATGALVALVLVLRHPVSRHFGPGMAYALWALPLLRLVTPPLVVPAPAAAVQPVLLVEAMPVVATGASGADRATSLAWLEPVLLGLWLAGAAAFLAWRTLGYHRLRLELLAHAQPVGLVGDVRLIESPATVSPLAFGFFDKVIALPPGFMTSSDRRVRDLAIAHELEHHAGRDIAVNMAMQPLLALHWFNPLAWLAWRALRRDQEAACDARVVAGQDRATRAAYGALIADFARAPRTSLAASLACPVVGEASVVHRLRSLTMTDPTPARRILGRLLLAGGALILPLTASVSYASADPAEPAKPRIETRKQIVIVDQPEGADAKDPKLETRVIEQDGKTIVLKTAKPLSDGELQERIARAEAMVLSSGGRDGTGNPISIITIGDGKAGPNSQEHISDRVIVLSSADIDKMPIIKHSSVRIHLKDGKPVPESVLMVAADQAACDEGSEVSKVESDETKGDVRNVMMMRVCSRGGSPAMKVEAMKKARERVSANTVLSAEAKDKILKNLDEQIEKMSQQR